MIDQIRIDHDIENVPIDHTRYPYSAPQKIFFYEISEDVIGKKFKFNFECEDNNHTNGFMSATGLLQFRSAYIIPKSFISYYFSHKESKTIQRMISNRFHAPWPRGQKSTSPIQDNCWPYQRINWQWDMKGQKYNSQEQKADNYPGWVGGNFSVEIEVIKKHGVRMFNPYVDKNKKYGEILTAIPLHEKSLEKYYKLNMFNEDQ